MNILKTKQKELQMIFIAVIIIFAGFLLLPFIEILYQSIAVGDGVGLKHFATMLDEDKFATAFGNSIACRRHLHCVQATSRLHLPHLWQQQPLRLPVL